MGRVFGEKHTKNQSSMRRCIIMVRNPCFLSLCANIFTQVTHNAWIIVLLDSLASWKVFVMYNTTIIEENCQHQLDFRTTLARSFWFGPHLLNDIYATLFFKKIEKFRHQTRFDSSEAQMILQNCLH